MPLVLAADGAACWQVEDLFAQADKEGCGRVEWRGFMLDFGCGTQCMPEFIKPRYLRQSLLGRIWQWHPHEQSTNSHRRFQVIDDRGQLRYHCKSCHGYLEGKNFTEGAIRSKIHYCSKCMIAMQIGCEPGHHTQRLPPAQWPRAESKVRPMPPRAG